LVRWKEDKAVVSERKKILEARIPKGQVQDVYRKLASSYDL
jgi:hypothetical protein